MCKVIYFSLRSVGRRHLSAGPEQKKHHPGCFFCSGPGERQGKEKPRAGTGPEQKNNTIQGVFFFFAAAPAKGKGRRSPVGRRHGARAKKKHHPGCFFLLRPRGKAGEGEAPLGAGTGPEQKKTPALAPCRRPTGLLLPLPFPGAGAKKTPWVVFFFCSGPVPAPNGASPSLAFRWGRSKKNLGGVFFFLLWPRAGTGLLLPLPFPGVGAKKKHPGWCFLLLRPRADAHSLTAGLLADASPSPGGVFFFAAAPPAPGWCLFFCCGPARTITHSLWAGAISARPGWCFFLLRPRRVFLDNNKNVWGTSSGLKRPGGATAKKKTPLPFKGSLKGSIRVL